MKKSSIAILLLTSIATSTLCGCSVEDNQEDKPSEIRQQDFNGLRRGGNIAQLENENALSLSKSEPEESLNNNSLNPSDPKNKSSVGASTPKENVSANQRISKAIDQFNDAQYSVMKVVGADGTSITITNDSKIGNSQIDVLNSDGSSAGFFYSKNSNYMKVTPDMVEMSTLYKDVDWIKSDASEQWDNNGLNNIPNFIEEVRSMDLGYNDEPVEETINGIASWRYDNSETGVKIWISKNTGDLVKFSFPDNELVYHFFDLNADKRLKEPSNAKTFEELSSSPQLQTSPDYNLNNSNYYTEKRLHG